MPDGPDQLGVLCGTWREAALNGDYALGFGFAPDTPRPIHVCRDLFSEKD